MILKESLRNKNKEVNFNKNSLTGGRRSMLSNHFSIGNYQMMQKIGNGGFATVKKAMHTLTGEFVAVKIVQLAKLCDGQRRSLRREINIHKTLIHQNIAQIYEVQEQNGYIYIFMELCSRGELFDHINCNGPLSLEETKKLFAQIYSAVCYLHDHSISHRDIKTENILLDQSGNAKLIDFGLSSYYENNFENPLLTTFCGSPSYLSPEMVSKKKYDPKMIDVWCLGVTLYAMLRAELPFFHENPDEQKKKITQIQYEKLGDQPTDRLLSQIFLPVSKRISLASIKNSQFCSDQRFYSPNFLTLEMQCEAIDEETVEKIEKKFSFEAGSIRKSIKEKKLDDLYGLYYLTLEKNRRNGKESYYDVKSSIFMKGRTTFNLSKEKTPLKRTSKLSTQRKMKKELEKQHEKMVKKLFSTPKKKIQYPLKEEYPDVQDCIFKMPAKLTVSHQFHKRKVSDGLVQALNHRSGRRKSEVNLEDDRSKIVFVEQVETIGGV